MSFPKQIFKAYDIRGLAKEELSSDLAYKIGQAVVKLFTKDGRKIKILVVARDMRTTSEEYQRAVISGITDMGVDMVDIGLATTPLFNFACANYGYDGGVMVTASHNPAEYNGFKITLGNGLPVGKNTGMDELRDYCELGQTEKVKVKGEVSQKVILDDYLNRVTELADFKKEKKIKLVIDAGNGMAKVTIPALLNKIGVQAEFMYLEPDGNFPNHEANPLKTETLRDLQKKVVETKADFGFALDGDADRIGLVDENGAVVDASFVGALIGLEVLKKYGKGTMLYDLRSSAIVGESWNQAGGQPEMCEVGHALIKKKMKEKNAIFASELSLHLYYHDVYDLECPELSLLYILKILTQENKPLSDVIAPLKKYFHSGEINFKVEDKEKILKRIEETYGPSAQEISHLDGVWMKTEWGWLNVRPSNTEPVLRLTLEAKTKEQMEEKVADVKKIIISQ